jgi:hypothetical protein
MTLKEIRGGLCRALTFEVFSQTLYRRLNHEGAIRFREAGVDESLCHSVDELSLIGVKAHRDNAVAFPRITPRGRRWSQLHRSNRADLAFIGERVFHLNLLWTVGPGRPLGCSSLHPSSS